MKSVSQNPIQLERARIFACPKDGCRKKMDSLRALNIHLKMKHDSEFKIELDAGSYAITVMS